MWTTEGTVASTPGPGWAGACPLARTWEWPQKARTGAMKVTWPRRMGRIFVPSQPGLRYRIAANRRSTSRATHQTQLPVLKIDWPLSPIPSFKQWPHHPASFRLRGAFADALATSIHAAAVHFHRRARQSDRRQNFSDGSPFRARSESARIACRALLLATGNAEAAFRQESSRQPAAGGPAVKADAAIDVKHPASGTARLYFYPCSLTTPALLGNRPNGCAEAKPDEVAEADVCGFTKLYPMNARPVQKDQSPATCHSSLRNPPPVKPVNFTWSPGRPLWCAFRTQEPDNRVRPSQKGTWAAGMQSSDYPRQKKKKKKKKGGLICDRHSECRRRFPKSGTHRGRS